MVTWHGQFLEEGACAWPPVRAEHPPGSFAELVEVVLQNVDLALDLLKGGHLRCDEDPAGGIDCRALQSDLHPCGNQLAAGLDVQLEDAGSWTASSEVEQGLKHGLCLAPLTDPLRASAAKPRGR